MSIPNPLLEEPAYREKLATAVDNILERYSGEVKNNNVKYNRIKKVTTRRSIVNTPTITNIFLFTGSPKTIYGISRIPIKTKLASMLKSIGFS